MARACASALIRVGIEVAADDYGTQIRHRDCDDITHVTKKLTRCDLALAHISCTFDDLISVNEFAKDQTLGTLTDAGFRNCMQNLPLTRRVTHPASSRYPDATFDYIFARNALLGIPRLARSTVSDHLPVTCDVEISSTPVASIVDTPKYLTIIQPVTIQIPYGKTVIPRGSRLQIVSRTSDTVIVRYMDGTYAVPISSTDSR